jgi:hypothetical protein
MVSAVVVFKVPVLENALDKASIGNVMFQTQAALGMQEVTPPRTRKEKSTGSEMMLSQALSHPRELLSLEPLSHPEGGVGWRGHNAAVLREVCGASRGKGSFFIAELVYPQDEFLFTGGTPPNSPQAPNTIRYLLSLHSPAEDGVLSAGMLGWCSILKNVTNLVPNLH